MTPSHPDAARAELVAILRKRMGTVYTSKATLLDTADALLAFVQQREGALKEMLDIAVHALEHELAARRGQTEVRGHVQSCDSCGLNLGCTTLDALCRSVEQESDEHEVALALWETHELRSALVAAATHPDRSA